MPEVSIQQAYELALQHHHADNLSEAEAIYRRIIAIQPGHFEALSNLGLLLAQKGKIDEAMVAMGMALQIAPNYAEAHNNLGILLAGQERGDSAAASFRRALHCRRSFPEAWNNLGNTLGGEGRLEEAIDAYRQALRIRSDYVWAQYGLANALREIGHLDEALAAYRDALRLAPNHHHARLNYSTLLLLLGQFEEGLALYEARWDAFPSIERRILGPKLNGEMQVSGTVLILSEQGFGDALQFVRYAELLARAGATRIIVECEPALARLFRNAKSVTETLPVGSHIPEFDWCASMLSLPLLLKTRPEDIPGETPYIFAEKSLQESWKQQIVVKGSCLRVGLAWIGNPENRETPKRKIPLEKFTPVLQLNGIAFFSLQVGYGTEQIRQLPATIELLDYSGQITDFADTAAFMMELDLIISVDTAVAHLAGAMGRPVWTLLPFVADWRWGLGSEKTPWYPTMRLFRQHTRGDWDSVIKRVAWELRELANIHAVKQSDVP